MALTEQDLRPYLSLVVATSDDVPAEPDSFIDDLIDSCVTGLGVDHDTTSQRQVIDRLPFATNGGVRSRALVYAVRRTPAWAMPSADIADVRHNLLLVAAVGSYVAIVATEKDAGKRLSRRIGTGVGALGSLRRLSPGILNAAFARGAAKTLWLSGVHRSTPTRADSKVLSGSALQAALSPVGDQSYAFTAARADSQIANLPHGEAHQVVGYSPRGSRLWIGPSKDWDWFASSVEAVLRHLALADGDGPVVAPLPYLATQSSDDVALDDAYDIALVSPDALALAEIGDDDERARSERWTYSASFEVDTASTSGPDFDAAVILHGGQIGTLRFKVNVASANDVRWDVVPITVADDRADDLYDAVQAVSDPAAVTIHYNTGQTVREGAIYEIRHRDTPFTRWRFETLDDVCVRREKPMRNRSFANDAIGAVDGDALFDWIARSWPPTPSAHRKPSWHPTTGPMRSPTSSISTRPPNRHSFSSST